MAQQKKTNREHQGPEKLPGSVCQVPFPAALGEPRFCIMNHHDGLDLSEDS